MIPIINRETGEFRIEDNNGDVIFGPTDSYNWPITKDKDAMEAVLSEANIGQPKKDMWLLVLGAKDVEFEGELNP